MCDPDIWVWHVPRLPLPPPLPLPGPYLRCFLQEPRAAPRQGTKLLHLALRHLGLWGEELTKDPLSLYLGAPGQESRKHISLAQTVSLGQAQPIAPPAKDNTAQLGAAGAQSGTCCQQPPGIGAAADPLKAGELLRASSSAAACRGQWRGAVVAVAGCARTANPPLKRLTEFGGLYLVASAHSRSCRELCV